MKVYVAAHKYVDGALPQNYEYIQGGAALHEQVFPLTDATGDHISEKNPYYCELTCAYWVWKNDRENEIVGLMHYRRFLTENVFSRSERYFVNSPKAERLLETYDFIAPREWTSPASQRESLLESVREKDLDLLREVMAERCPEYLPAWEGVLSGRKSYLLNMFLCKKQTWDAYYAWLFDLLGALETRVDMTGYSVQEQRLFGYLGERLFTAYVRKNEMRVKHFPVLLREESFARRLWGKAKRILHING